MDFNYKSIGVAGLRISSVEGDVEVGRAFLYVLRNGLHERPFGLMEDVFVEESHRGRGIGSEIVEKVIEEAKSRRCYKLICTSRYEKPRVHKLYEGLGFKNHGREFRIDFE